MKIICRVDASLEIGSGHVMRCLALAESLQERGDAVGFLCRNLKGNLGKLIESRGFPVHFLKHRETTPDTTPAHATWLRCHWHDDAKDTLSALATDTPDWLVVDHYALDARWEMSLRGAVRHILAIDDLADRPHDADLLLDQNFRRPNEALQMYRDRLPHHAEILLGPRYALLRPEFARLRHTALNRDGQIARILIFMGGADLGNFTALALDAVLSLQRELAIEIVVGGQYPYFSELSSLCADKPRVTLHRQTPHIAELLAGADLAIGAGGISCWERAALRIPSIVLGIADNQRHALRALELAGCIVAIPEAETLSKAELCRKLEALLDSPETTLEISKRNGELTDGLGCERVIRAMDHIAGRCSFS